MSKYTYEYGVTLEYSKFNKLIDTNREVKKSQLAKLKSSINGFDLTPANPIIVANGFIIDGQHRFDACRELGLPISYVEIKGMSAQDMNDAMHILNSNAKNWGLKDYHKLYFNLGYEDYMELLTFMTSYSLSISQSVYALSKFDDNVYKDTSLTGFKEGTFKIQDKENAVEKARIYKSVLDTLEANSKQNVKIAKQAAFIKGFFKLVVNQEIDTQLFLDNLRADLKYPKVLQKTDSVSGYHDMLVKIYNRNSGKLGKLKNWSEMGYDLKEDDSHSEE